ncbi:hypothetical protein [Pseudomonas faucium]|uniref:hypothetical protein n=1 Tax=Pseudomonas faucium TaxID=2740518 RepID=UPI001F190302|nr:hypothetical protein [Pseudomonas faucium]
MFVQFSDSTQSEIVSVFAEPQDNEVFPFQGEVEDSDERYCVFLNPPAMSDERSPVDKLKDFLEANPDVANILK